MRLTKKHLLFADAETLYVIEQRTVEEISEKLKVNEKTVRNWKAEGNWDSKRIQYIKSKQMFHEDLYNFARKLMATIEDSFEKGERVDPGRLYAFMRMVPMITKIRDYEAVIAKSKSKKENQKGLSKETVKQIESEILGIYPDEA
jgi:hypothetical protein